MSTKKQNGTKKTQNDAKKDVSEKEPGKVWGREYNPSLLNIFFCACIVLFCPLLVIFFWSSCTHFQCSIYDYVLHVGTVGFVAYLPKFDPFVILMYFGWIVFQGLLFGYMPGRLTKGQITPAGYELSYIVNGLNAYIFTHVLFGVGGYLGLWKLSLIHNYWGGFLIAVNIYGYSLSFFSYFKAHYFPTHSEDRKFAVNPSFIYKIHEFYFGIELNPRFGKLFDFKLFHNGRPGIIAWTLIDLSFAAAQYEKLDM